MRPHANERKFILFIFVVFLSAGYTTLKEKNIFVITLISFILYRDYCIFAKSMHQILGSIELFS
jgi:hypothetical protein